MSKTYSVHQVANMSGISVRTLHYYDEIGLLKPAQVDDKGYRFYGQKELLLLQQILFYKELDFPLEQIKEIIFNNNFNILKALEEHKRLLQLKQKKLEKLLITINKTMSNLKHSQPQGEELYDAFKDEEYAMYKDEVQQRWGNTEAYKQSVSRMKKMTKADMERIKKEGEDITRAISLIMDKGIRDQEVQKLIAQHHAHISTFYDCSYEMYKGLGAMYVADTRFTAYYEKYAPHLAQFMKDAIAYYCDVHSR